MKKTLIVTGGAGFIGSQFLRTALAAGYRVVCYDALTYAGHLGNIADLQSLSDFNFVQGNICDSESVWNALSKFQPEGIIHFAAESHVDNSISSPRAFLDTNILGTFTLLESWRKYVKEASPDTGRKRFLHVSTDEVFGALGSTGRFSENTAYAPNSPYSASKAGSDHIARAWHHTYGLDIVITNCSNNYGPRQFPEKLIPRMILNGLRGLPLPVYGTGENIRDWIHVEDHCDGVLAAYEKGRSGESYCLGGNSERRNLHVVEEICRQLDKLSPRPDGHSYGKQIEFVEDRLGHDFRYAIDDAKASEELLFRRRHSSFEEGLNATIRWYLDNPQWLKSIEEQRRA